MDEEVKAKLRERQSEMMTLIEALVKLDKSKEWGVVKELVFDRSLTSIERQLMNESLAPEVSTSKIYKLQGEWAWAKQFCDVNRFVENLKKQLENLNKQIK